jgi:hypothetical protein
MTFFERLFKLEQLDQLIRLKATGSPRDLARKLKISERSVYDLLLILKTAGASINYNMDKGSYEYETEIKFCFRLVLPTLESKKIQGGENNLHIFSPLQNFCSNTSHLCNKLINNEEGNDAGGFRYLGFGY